jgi:hypothetical protein
VVNESIRPKIRTGEKGGVQTGKYAFLVAPQMPKARRVNEPAAVRTFEGLRFVHEGQAPRGQMNIQAPIQHPTVLIPAVPTLGCQLQTVHLPTVFNDGHVAGLVGRTHGNRLPNSQLTPKENPDVEEELRASHYVKIREFPIFSQII